ncbi:MAG: amino acid adenylation domain-containing protein, partial [Pseudomonadota bacterium]
HGGRCVMADVTRGSFAELGNIVDHQSVDTAWLTSSLFNQLIVDSADALKKLRRLLVGGEALSTEHVRHALSRLPQTRLINGYGPTENTTFSCTHAIVQNDVVGRSTVPIGRPIGNTQAYVLGSQGEPVPIGVMGELYLGGAGLVRGYLDQPGLTAERFVPNGFSADAGSRLYRTGDLVRWLPGGTLEFLGRMDHQVKIRGYRIELGEIESVLRTHECVRDAVVIARDEQAGIKRLVGYVVAEADAHAEEITLIQQLRSFLQQRLPAYLVPSALMVLETLPLTANGKLDRNGLPAPQESADAKYAPPQGATEELLALLWCSLLKREQVGRHDSFFELGGHSLLAMQLVSRIRETFSTELRVRELFEHSTLSSQAQAIERAHGSGTHIETAMEPVSREQPLPLSYAQQRLWFLQQYLGPNAVYNMPLALRLQGAVNEAALLRALEELHRRHESLRTRFETRDGIAVQLIDAPELVLEVEPVSVAEARAISGRERCHHFDLARDRLCRMRVLRETEGEDRSGDYVLLVTMHHSVSDGWSLGVFFRELVTMYQAFANGQHSPLAPLPIQYADYAVWQRNWLQGDVLERQVSYWREQLKGLPQLLTLPTDRPRPAEQTFRGSIEPFALSAELSTKLQALSREQGATLYMTLLSAFAVLLGRYSGQQDVPVGTAIANRTRRQTEGLIGFFVNMLVMRHDLSGDPHFVDLLKATRATTLEAYAHQDVPFEHLVEELNPARNVSYSPLFQVAFALVNTDFNSVELPGVALLPLQEDVGADHQETSRFDLTLSAKESPAGLIGSMEYNADLFDRDTIRRLLGHYARLLEAIAHAPQTRLSQLRALSPEEERKQLVDWNSTASQLPCERCVHELFEEQAELAPDRIAFVQEGAGLTYRELNERANWLAHGLSEQGVSRRSLVGLCVDHGVDRALGVLGILKAGGAYVCLNAADPAERLAYLLEDCEAELVITSSSPCPSTELLGYKRVALHADGGPTGHPRTNPELAVNASDLACVQYEATSANGAPVGTMIAHSDVLAEVLDRQNLVPERRLASLLAPPISVREDLAASIEACEEGTSRGATQYVLGRHGELLPAGAVGELCVGVDAAGGGYLHRPALTAERYVPDSFSMKPGARLHRTGQWARWSEDGKLEIVARETVFWRDHEKVRVEIERELLCHEGVREAAVVVLESATHAQHLLAYVVAREPSATPERFVAQLNAHLRSHSTSHRLPEAWMVLAGLPVTADGKLDREALPTPDDSPGEKYEPPEGVTEELLAQLWCSLLGRERIGRHDNFFELGGHSLLATQLVSRIRGTFSAEVPVRTLFEHATLSSQAAAVDRARNSGAQSEIAIRAVSRDQPLPLSYAQQRLWFLDQYLGSNAVYNMPLALRLRGEVDEQALVRSFAELQCRHESLRTRFVPREGSAVQLIDSPALELAVEPVSTTEAQAIARCERTYQFDLSRDRLCRIRLLHEMGTDVAEPGDYVLLVTMHHIISDGWSLGVFFRELMSLYQAFSKGESSPLAPLPIQYADYALWQRNWLQGAVLERQMSYWREQLKDLPPLLTLPTDRPRPAEQTFRGSTERFVLPLELSGKLHALSRAQGVTLYMTLLSAFAVLLSRYSGQQDVAVGTPIANRTRRETEAVVGFFTNTLVMRHDLSGDPRFVEVLERTRETALAAYAHQDVPFEHLVEALNPERRLGHSPLFQAMFMLQNAPSESLELPGLKVQPFAANEDRQGTPDGSALFDLTLGVQETSTGLLGAAEYNTDLFDRTTVRRLLDHYARLLEVIAEAPSTRLSQIDTLGAEERRVLMVDWNATSQPYPVNKCVHELFSEQVERTPEAIAVVDGPERLTYAELDRRSNQLAHYLRAIGVGPERSVVIYLERSKDMIVGLLGVLKAGGAYVPLDPIYPADRVAQVLQDAQPVSLLTHRHLLDRLSDHPPALCMDSDWQRVASQPDDTLHAGALACHLAYVIYTSGSTGKPKGVQVEHRSLLNVVYGHHAAYLPEDEAAAGLGHLPRQVALNASIAFDASVPEYLMLLEGATLHIVPEEVRASPAALASFLAEHRIDVFDCVPSQMKHLLEELKHPPQLVMLGGEATDAALWRQLSERRTVNACNLYGPTECTVDATYCPVDGTNLSPLIGRPLPNVQVYILDAHLQPVPVCVTGEICIGGAGLARGYLNSPQQTAKRFVADPFSGRAGARLYRTGDLGRWRTGGNIEYLGRNDSQVKIHGHRVELGEIESVLLAHEAVRDAVVVMREEAEVKRLVCYMVAEPGVQKSETELMQELRIHLQERLPDHMVPSALVALESLPLTSNGKLDRNALPTPGGKAFAHRQYEAPQGPIESALAILWREVLGVERVGRHDNFFELGGHSLLAVTLIERMRSQGLEADVRALFNSPTLLQLAEAVVVGADVFRAPQNRIPPDADAITPEMLPLVALEQQEIDRIVGRVAGGVRNVQDIYPLAPLQEGILFHYLMTSEGDPYLSQQLFSFDSRQRLDQYLAALQWVTERHDILRTGVQWEGLSQAVQVVWRQARLAIEEVEITSADAALELRERFDPQRFRLDIRDAPLQKAFVGFDRDQHRWLLLMLSHHLAFDHTSQEIIVAEAQSYLLGEQDRLPTPTPFREFVAQARLGVSAAEQEEFFRGMLSDIDQPTAPFGLLNVRGGGSGIAEAHVPVAEQLAKEIRRCAREAGVSAASLCHLAWALVLANLTGRKEVVFGTVLFGRLHGGEGVARGVGLFINTLPLRLSIGERGVQESLRSTHERLGQLLRHEHAPLALAQRCSAVPGESPLFTTLLNYRYADISAGNEQVQKAWEGIRSLYAEERTNYPLMLSVSDIGEHFWLTVQVSDQVEPRRIGELMHDALAGLVEALVGSPQTPIRTIAVTRSRDTTDLLSEPERHRQLVEWNSTTRDCPDQQCIHELFEARVRLHPDAVALRHEGHELTYRELNGRANGLARQLIERGVGPDVRVALCMERSAEMVIALLGILKAGGCYLPLDPSYPPQRLAYMLEDGAPAIVLTNGDPGAAVASANMPVITLDASRVNTAGCLGENLRTAERGLESSHLVYVIYTSGSSGRPKGTGMTHRSVVNLVEWHRASLGHSDGECVLQFAALSFDVAFQEIFYTLCTGGTLVLLDGWVRQDAHALLRLIDAQAIQKLFLPPAMLHVLAECFGTTGVTPGALRDVICAGEQLRISPEIATFFERIGKCRLHNHYGPTETHVVTAWTSSGESKTWPSRPPIGRPIQNVRIHLLDSEQRLVPSGVAGELHIGGAALSRGYLDHALLTGRAFIPDPFDSGSRLYKTGDLARWLSDGTLEYLGRIDTQVKVRGFRIELGEIESALLAHEWVGDAVVVAREGVTGGNRLMAYIVAHPGAHANEAHVVERLRIHLQERLPAYMVPSALMLLASLPLTANGKLDRAALPTPDTWESESEYKPPKGPTEELLAQLWCGLLKCERVGRHDNFFELGGHSLLAMQLASRIRETFSTELAVRELFEHSTLSSQAAAVERARGASALIGLEIEVVPRQQPLPLSYAQQRLWFMQQFIGANAVYNMPLALRLQGKIDEAALLRSLAELYRRHESLRTHFESKDFDVVQVIDPPSLELEVELVSAAEVQAAAFSERSYHFDLSRDRLCRIRLLREKTSEADAFDYVLLVTMHHSVSDGWSLGVFFRELVSLYEAYANGEDSPLAPLRIQYADFAQWQRHWLQGEVLERQVSYWRKQLKDLPPLLKLPTDRPRPSRQTFGGGMEGFALTASLSQKLQSLSREQGATMYMTLLSAFAVLLGRYSGQQDVAIGTPIANRSRRDTEGLIGLFVNTLVMRHDLSGDPRFVDLLKGTRETALEAYAHQDVPFEQLVEALNPHRSLSHSPLFQVMFILQNAPFDGLELRGLEVKPLEAGGSDKDGESSREGVARFDMTLNVQETPAGLVGGLEYNTDLFDRSTIRSMLAHYTRLLEAIASSPQEKLSRLEILSETERRQQIVEWNMTTRGYPDDKCIHELFEAHAEQAPDRIALMHEESELTYGELNQLANQLAHQLIDRGVGPESPVGLCLRRSPEMVIGMLGILKAGGTYVPLDPDYPHKRLGTLLEEARIRLVVTEHSVASRVAGQEREVLILNGRERPEMSMYPVSNVDRRARGLHPDHPAYLIYTSASSGNPKAVLGLHRSIVNRVSWLAGTVSVGAHEVLCQKTSLAFVDHVAEIFQALSAGVPLVIIASPLLQAPRELLRKLDARRVTQMTLVPSFLKAVLEESCGESARWLECLYSSGEALHLSSLEKLSECFPQARLFNIYGSTEMGADVTCQEVRGNGQRTQGAEQWATIGKGIHNTQVYVLDADGQLAMPGATGELHVGGVCLSRGYFGRPRLTAERFVPSAFARAPGERLYRTGDLARWRTDGTLEYLGRIDSQVKLRGHRIELGEIEGVLRAHEALRDAVVVALEYAGDTRLVAYVVASAGAQADEAALINELRSGLHEHLPSYMVPSVFMVLEALPLTTTGKIDRQVLPKPGGEAGSLRQYVAPEGDIELTLAKMWQELLRIERVGRHDNFFELGGHSLLALRVCSAIRHSLGVEIRVPRMFANPSVAQLAEEISLEMNARNPPSNRLVSGVSADDFEEGSL